MVSSSIFFCMALLTDYKRSFQNKFKGLRRDEISSAEFTDIDQLTGSPLSEVVLKLYFIFLYLGEENLFKDR